ncbi:MAG: hypothetical protein ACW963_07325 [Candidatus Sifarchaeia archaeon]|jgi:hypothetical protein
MSDFSELCPLFNTGVFQELTFHNVKMSHITAVGNVFLGTLTAGATTKPGIFTFGRTVVVTDCFIKKNEEVKGLTILRLMHHTSQLAAGTEFMSYQMSITASTVELYYTWVPMNVTTSATFTSDEVLGLTVATGSAASGGVFDVMLRYKEA